MQEKKSSNLDAIVVGLALFAMFFGAGNLVFPPMLGLNSGTSWFAGFMGFFVADAGLAIVGIFSVMKLNGDINNVTRPIGKVGGIILVTSIILCIGPFLAIPRTAATTFEVGVMPIFNVSKDNSMAMIITSIVFFVITFVLSIRPSKVVDIVGKFLTPVLVACAALLIILGIVSPAAQAGAPVIENVVKQGVIDGYNTMDAMGSILFATIVINAIYAKGYKKGKAANAAAAKSAVVAGIMLFLIYGGLTFLGATTGAKFAGQELGKAELLIGIVEALMGYTGVVIIGVIVLMACLTTSIGLTTVAGNYFSDISGGKLKYEVVVTVVCIFSAVVANFGLDNIIAFAVPILILVYPVIILLMIVAFLQNVIRRKTAYIFAAWVALFISLATVLADGFFYMLWFKEAAWASFLKVDALSFVHSLPLDEFGLNWLVPTAVAFVIGMLIPGKDLEPVVIEEEA